MTLEKSSYNISEVELSYKNRVKPKDRIRITCSSIAYNAFLNFWDMDKIELVEQFNILLLNTNSACIGASTIATGGMSACIVDPKIIFTTALKANARGIIVAHNHPSTSVTPSQPDISVTQQLADGAAILGLYLADSMIISEYGYFSFADEGMISRPVPMMQPLIS